MEALLAEDPRGAGKADLEGHGACARVASGPVVEQKVQVDVRGLSRIHAN
jgi:hypothetical protein